MPNCLVWNCTSSTSRSSVADESCFCRNRRNSKLVLPIPSKTTIVSSNYESDCPLLWSGNRSFFLRMTENRRKKHRHEWEKVQKAVGFIAIPPAHSKDKLVQDLQHELAEAKKEINFQNKKIQILYEELAMARTEKKIQQENDLQYNKNAQEKERRNVKASQLFSQCPDEKGHGDKTLDEIFAPVYNTVPNQSLEQQSCINEAGDVTLSTNIKEYDQGYYSLPRRSESFIINQAQILPEGLPASSSSSESLMAFREDYKTVVLDSSSLLTPNRKSPAASESVGCQTDLTLFTGNNRDFSNVLIMMHSQRNKPLAKSPQVLQKKTAKNDLVLQVLPHILILSSIWRNSHDHILDLQYIVNRFVLPGLRKWFRNR